MATFLQPAGGLLAAMTNYGWEPGPGDPSPAGWTIFFSYLIVTFYLWRTTLREKAAGRDPFLWRILYIGCFALALNKQLDLHNAITAVGRAMARSEGWYEQRRPIQLGMIVLVGLACVGVLAFILRRLGPNWRRHRLTLAGLVLLLGFIALRAASFHHVDWFLREEYIPTVRLHAIIEFTGIWLLFLAAWRAARNPGGSPARPPARSNLKRV